VDAAGESIALVDKIGEANSIRFIALDISLSSQRVGRSEPHWPLRFLVVKSKIKHISVTEASPQFTKQSGEVVE
jgi:hypothetical protein